MKKSEISWFVAGLLTVSLLLLPWLILGEGAVVTYHDQLDGEMIAYILQAKHLGEGDVLPEFMDGAYKTALTPPAPLSVLLFLGGNYSGALFVMQLLGSLIGYVGMFLLAREVTGKCFPAVIAGGLYGALPFLPVYGFSQYGLPMLLWCALQLKKGRFVKFAGVYGLVFALNSSLALVGFAVLGAFGAVIVVEAFLWKKDKGVLRQAILWLVLFAGYVATNLDLLGQVFGAGEGGTSHKAEYGLAAEGFWTGWVDGFFYGGQHSQDYHVFFLIAGIAVLAVFWVVRAVCAGSIENTEEWKGRAELLAKTAVLLLGSNLCLAGLAALWNSACGVAVRGHLGALGAFQVDRFLWLSPCLWYLFLACIIALNCEMFEAGGRFKPQKRRGIIVGGTAVLCSLFVVASLGLSGLSIVKNSDFKANFQKLRNPEYPAMSYEDYYAIGVYGQVEEFLAKETGLSQSEYRVVSLGIDPAAALYHGFYCLDGYSNNYSLEYKHAFREVIEPALLESDYLQDYYDNWGNRCYLFGSECPGYYTIEKNGFYFSHLELDVEALKNLGGNYLFSAAYIANAEELGLTLLRQEPFETPDSYYRIFVYEVEAP